MSMLTASLYYLFIVVAIQAYRMVRPSRRALFTYSISFDHFYNLAGSMLKFFHLRVATSMQRSMIKSLQQSHN